MTVCNNSLYSPSDANNSLIKDIPKKLFKRLLSQCNRYCKNDTIIFLALPRNEELIADFYRITYYSINSSNFLELDKDELMKSISNVAEHLSFSNNKIPLAIVKMDLNGNIIEIYQEDEE